jgi:hypothetical protein
MQQSRRLTGDGGSLGLENSFVPILFGTIIAVALSNDK